jgi:hypothetical protein
MHSDIPFRVEPARPIHPTGDRLKAAFLAARSLLQSNLGNTPIRNDPH